MDPIGYFICGMLFTICLISLIIKIRDTRTIKPGQVWTKADTWRNDLTGFIIIRGTYQNKIGYECWIADTKEMRPHTEEDSMGLKEFKKDYRYIGKLF